MSTFRTLLFSAAVLTGLSVSASAQAPANDICSSAAVASLGSNLFDSTGASTDGLALDPLVCDMSGSTDEQVHNDVWFLFTAPSTDDFTIDTDDRTGGGDTSFDTRLAVYDASTCPDDPALVIGCDDDQASPFSLQAGVQVSLIGGNTYLIRVGSFSSTPGVGGTGDLFIAVVVAPPLLPNDDCANATAVGTGTFAFDTALATTDGVALDPLVCDMGAFGTEQINNDIWYCFTAPNDADYDVTTFGLAGFDTRLAVYDDNCGAALPADVIACNDDFDGNSPFEAGLTFTGVGGTSYKIRLGGFGTTTTGSGDLLIAEILPPPPVNDDCLNASAIGLGLTAFDTTLATTDGVALDPLVCDMGPFGTEQINNDIWYCFLAPTTEDYDVTTFGLAGFDTRLAVYDNACGVDDPALVVACNDDFDGNSPFEAGLVFSAVSGTSYKIRLGGFGTTTTGSGDLLIQVSNPPMPPANDDCVNAAAIAVGLTAFDTALSTTDGLALDPLVCDMGPFGTEQINNDIWYCFAAPNDKTYIVTTFGLAGFDTRLAVYDNGCGVDDPALVIACNDDFDGNSPFEAGLSFGATAGVSYKIRLGGFGTGTFGSGDLLIEEVPNVVSFCFGDGLGRACKCGNDDVLNPGTGGCLNSNSTGAVLSSNGDSSVSSNDLMFSMTGGVPTALSVLTSGDNALGGGIGILGLPESDGLRCVGGNFRRHGSRALDGAGATANNWGSAAGPAGGIIGQAGFAAGQTRHFQARYREDPLTGPCGFGTNTSQAISVTFKP